MYIITKKTFPIRPNAYTRNMPTLIELPRADYMRVAHLFPPTLPNRTMVFSTLEHRTPGKIFVDDIAAPAACVLKTNYYNWSFIGGAPNADWLANVLHQLQTQAAFFLTAHDALDTLQPPLVPTRVAERFGFDDRVDDGSPYALPPGFSLREMDAALFARALWHNEIVLAMGSDENFLRNGRGMCVVRGDEICSEAYAVFRGDGKFELGIITQEKYRGRGFAYAACKALARACEAQGIPVYWSCDQTNLGSVATARKLGFQSEQPYQLFYYAREI